MLYKLPVNPSPNLNTEQSILLYPSTCLFEGVKINHGRGRIIPLPFLEVQPIKMYIVFVYTSE
ncbi:hypothetical protein [Sphingobacterium sp. E70]|uniref:hypothetical protein n=1 Tax=Sphingobacterium sp. E70 TaxID=2853439 RepID=UPI00359C655D